MARLAKEDDWKNSLYSKALFARVGVDPSTPGVAGIAEDDGDIVIWYMTGHEVRWTGMAFRPAGPHDGGFPALF